MTHWIAKGREEIQKILAAACLDRERLIIGTTGQNYDSNFLHLDGDELHLAATMSGDLYDLRAGELTLRFPSGSHFLEGATRLLGRGMYQGRSTLRISVPTRLEDDEQRRGLRVARPGKVEVSFHTKAFDLRSGRLVDISTGGLKVHASAAWLDVDLERGDNIAVTVPLAEGIRIDTHGVVRWVASRTMGLEFQRLGDETLVSLTRWIFQQRQLEKGELWQPARRPLEAPQEGAYGMVLACASPALEASLRAALGDVAPLRRIPPTPQALKDALRLNPSIVFIQATGSTLDDRKRLKPLAELLAGHAAAVLLGTDLEQPQLFQLGGELKIRYCFASRSLDGPIFRRTIEALLRQQGGEGLPNQG